ncbi:MAG TPA: hypothetical protein V6C97_00185 [Oculatellaceae cyanobacterium]
MDNILWGIALFVGILLALNQMAGGKATYVLQPVVSLAVGLLSMAVNLFLQVLRIGISAGTSSLRSARRLNSDQKDQKATPPRW